MWGGRGLVCGGFFGGEVRSGIGVRRGKTNRMSDIRNLDIRARRSDEGA